MFFPARRKRNERGREMCQDRDAPGCRGFAGSTDVDRVEIFGGALCDRIVGSHRGDLSCGDIDADRQRGIRRENVEDVAARCHLAGLVDAVVSEISDVLELLR